MSGKALNVKGVFLLMVVVGASGNQIIGAYYSGLGADTVGAGGLNTLMLCFFSPSAMTDADCDFTSGSTPCVAPAAGGGTQTLKWVWGIINATREQLSSNTSPIRDEAPTYLVSFGRFFS
jgi:hypothetical protein